MGKPRETTPDPSHFVFVIGTRAARGFNPTMETLLLYGTPANSLRSTV